MDGHFKNVVDLFKNAENINFKEFSEQKSLIPGTFLVIKVLVMLTLNIIPIKIG